MATFGKTEIGSLESSTVANYLVGSKFTCPSEGDVTKLSAYIKAYTTPGNVKAKIYSDLNGSPKALLAESAEVYVGITFAWVDFLITGLHVYANTPYWLVFFTGITLAYKQDVGSPSQGFHQTNAWQTYPTNPSTITYPVLRDYERSIYATYTPTGVVTYNLTVQSDPISGVPVTLDGTVIGNTPIVRSVTPGGHNIVVPAEVVV